MSFRKQYISYIDELLQKCTPEKLDYLSVVSLRDGTHSFKVYEKQALVETELDVCSRDIMNTGLIASTMYVSSGSADTDRYDFHISNQRNTDERMRELLGILQRGFGIAPAAMQEIFALSQMPVLPEGSGYRALYCVGVERHKNLPHTCKMHFRTRMSIHYKDCFMDELYLSYLSQHLPFHYNEACAAARLAIQAGHLLLVGADCCGGSILKRKIYIKITNIDAMPDAIRGISLQPCEYAAFYSRLSDAVEYDGRMFIDGFALCFSDNYLSSINYYLAVRRSHCENIPGQSINHTTGY